MLPPNSTLEGVRSMEDLINNDAELLLAAVLNLEQCFFFVGIQVLGLDTDIRRT